MAVALIVVVLLVIGGYFLFRDSMNRFQAIFCLRIYWVTRDTGRKGDPFIKRAWTRQTAAPWWRGNGIEVRIRRHTFQVGILVSKGRDLRDQISNLPDFDPSLEEIRQWQ